MTIEGERVAGFSDVEQRLCLALALWNGRDTFLKERAFGLTGPEGNYGEDDVKEHWWYIDALPSHAWNRWRYHYPQAAFPYDQIRLENSRRDRRSPEYEIPDVIRRRHGAVPETIDRINGLLYPQEEQKK